MKSNKKLIFAAILVIFSIMPIFAAGGETITALDDWSNKILELFQSTWVKVILLVALIVEAIGLIVAGQNGGGAQIIKRFSPWIIGTIILLCASGICTYFVGDLNFEIGCITNDAIYLV